jgi:hypothetical protein
LYAKVTRRLGGWELEIMERRTDWKEKRQKHGSREDVGENNKM